MVNDNDVTPQSDGHAGWKPLYQGQRQPGAWLREKWRKKGGHLLDIERGRCFECDGEWPCYLAVIANPRIRHMVEQGNR